MHHRIGCGGIIRLQMHREVVRSLHTGMHHEDARMNGSAFAGFEHHRTDGQLRRSTSIHDFDVGFVFET
jgi:hypothetical protein